MMTINTEEVFPRELQAGWRFMTDEGGVTVVCRFGECEHDDRPQSVHVRDGHSHWFVALNDAVPVSRITGFSF